MKTVLSIFSVLYLVSFTSDANALDSCKIESKRKMGSRSNVSWSVTGGASKRLVEALGSCGWKPTNSALSSSSVECSSNKSKDEAKTSYNCRGSFNNTEEACSLDKSSANLFSKLSLAGAYAADESSMNNQGASIVLTSLKCTTVNEKCTLKQIVYSSYDFNPCEKFRK